MASPAVEAVCEVRQEVSQFRGAVYSPSHDANWIALRRGLCEGTVDGMLQPDMVEETTVLMRSGVEQKVQMNVIINNRAGGNAPLIAQQVSRRFLETFS